MTGTMVGHYEVLDRLGEGGMGVVYRARDLTLNRTVALKFLPPGTGADDDRRRRFVQEARAASALNHPNIVVVHEAAEAGGHEFIAMELVQGRSLDQMIGGKPLPVGTALSCAIQVAGALAAAHAAGIVHRDLKPGNVMVSDSGHVKVLDFGIAKVVSTDAVPADTAQTMLRHTTTVPGLILGTASYMSPEQAEAKPVDHRSDIFSFGVLVYEMLTGHRAFEGTSAITTLSAIVSGEPAPLAAVSPDVPRGLVRIVERCLRKPPAERWQHIGDVGIALEDVKRDLDAGRTDARGVPAPAPRSRWLAAAAAAVVTGAVAAGVTWLAKPGPSAPERWHLRRLTAGAGASHLPAISRDGKLVAYVSDRSSRDSMNLWVQQIEGGDAVQLTRNLGHCLSPAFSPDGTRIAFRCGESTGSVYVVSTLGGLPHKLGEGEMPQFSPDGSRIAFLTPAPANAPSRSIRIVRADGSSSTDVTIARMLLGGPVWSPDGQGFFVVGFSNATETGRDWYFASAETGALTPTGAFARLVAASLGFNTTLNVAPDGLLFTNGNYDSSSILRMPFDRAFRTVSGDPVPIVVGPGYYFSPSASQDGRRVAFAIANNLSPNIWRARVDPATGMVAGDPVRVTSSFEGNRIPSPSRDGRRLAYLGGPAGAPEVRLRHLATGEETRLAIAKDWSVVTLSPDGSAVAFSSDTRSGSAIYTVPATGGVPTKACASCGRPVEWSADRSRIYFDNGGAEHREVHVLDVASGRSRPLLQHRESALTMPRVSPDGRHVAFVMVGEGRARRIYVAPLGEGPIPEERWTVLVDGSDLDRQPFWAPSGNLIYFLSERDGFRCIWAQRIDATTRRAAGQPFAAQHMHQNHTLQTTPDVAMIGLSAAGGDLFYAAFEIQSNVWLAERARAPAPSR